MEYIAKQSFWRSPYLASFSSGNFDFLALTVHIRWGRDSKSRRREPAQLADWIEAKRRDEATEDKDLIVMGDLNITSRRSVLFEAITKHGLQIPKSLIALDHGSNLARNKRYDQILHYPGYPDTFTNQGGVLDFYGDERGIRELFGSGMTKEQFTFQMSDHLPLWMQVRTDVEGFQLEQIIRG
jgi:endonuclease/exonuclease/phosphatase family metal-dependent hydrolase